MSAFTTTENNPRWASAPGSSIKRALSARGLNTDDLADALSISDPEARRLLTGEITIDAATASALSRLLGSTPSFWLTRENQYRESLKWLDADQIAQQSPLEAMINNGWLEAGSDWKGQARALLDYYGVQDADEWRAQWVPRLAETRYRTSPTFESSDFAVTAWLRRVEQRANQIQIAEWSPGTLRSILPKIRALSKMSDPSRFLPILEQTLASVGVAAVVQRPLDGNRLSGVATTLPNGTRAIGLTVRHMAEDHFWFTLFHEIGHLLMHGDDVDVLDELDDSSGLSQSEAEANEFAREALVPGGVDHLRGQRKNGPTARQVHAFASQLGVAPGVVVGQLHHYEILQYNQLRGLIRHYRWDGLTLRI